MVLLAAVAAGLLTATLWRWPVLARPGAAAVAPRIGLLVALQASVLGFVFVSVNRTYEFYASWSDLLGTDHSVAQVVAARPGAARAAAAGQPPMRGYSLIIPQGGHNFRTWNRELPPSLVWLSHQLS